MGDEPQREFYFPFLKTFPMLLRDQERRHQRKIPLRDPATATNKEEKIAALIDQLETISARPKNEFYADDSLSGSPTVQSLVNEGWDAIEPLLQCYEHDERLTRIIPVDHFSFNTERRIVAVRSVAYAALENILETAQFAPHFSGRENIAEKAAIYQTSALAIQTYWKKYRNYSRDERLYRILKDDHGQWLEAATIIVQTTNNPMLAESLRSKNNPSISELLVKRADDTFDQGTNKADDASALNSACSLAFCLTQWDPQTALKTIQRLCALSFEKLAPTNYSSLFSHQYLVGQLPQLVEFRAIVGDTNSLDEYARWLQSIDPVHFFMKIDSILSPVKQFSEAQAWTKVWTYLFDDEQSVWFNYLQQQSTPNSTSMSSPTINVGEYFGTQFINKIPFRKFVAQLLHDKSACGKIVGETAHGYWLDERLSIMRPYGFTVPSPADGSDIDGKKFRTCDFYAWLFSNRIEDASAFQLYWNEATRDNAIIAIEKKLDSNTEIFKTRPFQER